ncbi:MAG: hypothetical protein AABX30_03055 [Nanoarchaeota archaeon]
MSFKKSKKASHVGIIISFLIFITFLFVIFSYIYPPSRISNDKTFALDYLKTSLIEKFSTNLTTASIRIYITEAIESCFTISNPDPSQEKVIVKDENGNQIKASVVLSDSNIKIDDDGSKTFYKIYLSKYFQENSGTGKDCIDLSLSENLELLPGEYSLGSIRGDSYVYTGLIKIFSQMPYEQMKTELNLPASTNFIFQFNSPDVIQGGYKGDIPVTNVYAENIPITYFNESADIISGFINIKVW